MILVIGINTAHINSCKRFKGVCKMKILTYIDYKSSNVDNQLYLDEDLICNDLRNCKAFLAWLDLELISKETVCDSFSGERTIYKYYRK